MKNTAKQKPKSFRVHCKSCDSTGFNVNPHYLLRTCPWCYELNFPETPILSSGN